MTQSLTLLQLKNALKPLDMTVRYDAVSREYRINFKGGSESTSYYTTDAQDALTTAKMMHKRLWASIQGHPQNDNVVQP